MELEFMWEGDQLLYIILDLLLNYKWIEEH